MRGSARLALYSAVVFPRINAAAFINPRRACAARVTVVVCLSVCLLSHISPMERLFVLKTLSRTQRATKVKKFVGFSLKPLRCRDPALPPLYGHAYSRPFFHAYFSTRAFLDTRMIHRRGFSTLVLFIPSALRWGYHAPLSFEFSLPLFHAGHSKSL